MAYRLSCDESFRCDFLISRGIAGIRLRQDEEIEAVALRINSLYSLIVVSVTESY